MTYLPLQVAQDIVQDCFLQAFERWSTFQSVTHVRAALYTYVRNACISELRRETTKKAYHNMRLYSTHQEVETDAEDQLIWHETYRLLTNAIQNLPPQGKRVIQLSLEGMSNQKIADTLGISINSVKLYKSNAYKKIRKEFEENQHTDTIQFIALSFLLWSLQTPIVQ